MTLNLEDKGSDSDLADALKLAIAFAQEALQQPGCDFAESGPQKEHLSLVS